MQRRVGRFHVEWRVESGHLSRPIRSRGQRLQNVTTVGRSPAVALVF